MKHFNFRKPLHEIGRQEIMRQVETLRATPSEAKHAFVAIRTMMNWCVQHGLLEFSPVPRMSFDTPSRTRVLSDDELRVVWQRADEYGCPFGRIVQLLILTGQRRGEITALRRSWIFSDEIVFPAGFTKNKREHRFPIGPLTVELISSIPNMGDLLFPARGHDDRPYNGWSKSKRYFDKPLDIAPYTLHDLRRTFASNHARFGTPIHVTEKLLNHVSGTLSGVAAVYNRYSYMDEMREACTNYESWLTSLCS